MKDFFKDKFNYNFDANNKVIDLIVNKQEAFSPRAQTLFSHTLIAQDIWNRRILGSQSEHNVWDVFPIQKILNLNLEYHNISQKIVEEVDFKSSIAYTNSKGEKFINRVDDILYHIINHSTYHRGQLISELKVNGIVPVSTDFIFYKR